ncbi:MAG TPA: sigma-70 family RNA polymerase sigma factor [Solirubrobacteraceae bacterium]
MSALAVVGRPSDQDGGDLDLVAGVRAGNDRAFEALYVRYQARITAYVRGMVRDHGRAEDITQEVFMSALRRMRETETEIVFKPWIYEIAKNACIDAWRRGRNTNEVPFDAHEALRADDHGRLAGPAVTPHSAIDTKFAFDNLCGAFGGLSRTHHEILVMREFEGLSYREIGERLGMSRPGVESTLFRARRRLSEEYEELVSGERCRRVQQIIDSPGGRGGGLRDQRRVSRHISHCQPCRRYARVAGIPIDTAARPAAAAAAAAKIAAVTPLPLFLRRRGGEEEAAGHAVAQPHSGSVSQLAASVANALDPGTVSGWSKAIATVATVAVAGVGAGSAIKEQRAVDDSRNAPPPAAGRRAVAHVPAGAAQSSRASRRRAPSGGAPAPARPAGGGAKETSGDAPAGGDSGDPAPAGLHQRFSARGQPPAAGITAAPKVAEGGRDRGGIAPVAPPAVRAPQPPSLGDVAGGTQDAIAKLKTPPPASATTSTTVVPENSASTGFGATVSTVVTRTLSSTTAGHAAS